MRLLRVGTETAISFHRAAALASGGEGCIYPVPQDPSLLAKIYHQPNVERARKLALMVARPIDDPMAVQGHVSIAWPIDLLRDLDRRGEVVGFVMRRVNEVFPIVSFYNPSGRRQSCPLFNWRYLHQTARNLAAAFAAIHKRGDLVADVNSRNILASPRALVTLVDTDSFQVRDPKDGHVFRCPVGTAEYTPPELQDHDLGAIDRRVEHDCFGLAIVLFQLLMEGTHPFAGTYLGGGDPPPYEERIRLGHFPYSEKNSVPYRPMPIAPPLGILYPLLQHLFVRCFEEGYRNPTARPDAQSWQNALEEAETSLVSCTVNAQHRFGKHLAACPWCQRKNLLGGRDPFPSTQGVQRGEHLVPAPGANRRRPQPQQPRFGRVFTSRLGPFGLGQTFQTRYQHFRYQKSGGVWRPVPIQFPPPTQYPGTIRTPAQRKQAISSAVAVVIVAAFGLAVLSVSDWRVRVLSGGVAMMAFFGQKLFQKYPNLLAMAGVGYTGFTMLMVAGVLASFVVRPSFFGSSQIGAMFLGSFLFILGVFWCRAAKWRLTFLLKYAIFSGFALIGALVFSVDVNKIDVLAKSLEVLSSATGAASAHASPVESLRNLGGGITGLPKVAWSADGKTIARVDSMGTISFRDARSGEPRLSLHPSTGVSALAWSPDGRTLATGSISGMIEFWDAQSGHKQATSQQPGGAAALAWNPSGSVLASVSANDSIELWYGWGTSHSTLDHTGRVGSLVWDPEGKTLATATWSDTIRLWDTDARQITAQSDTGSIDVTWSPDGTTLATAGMADRKITLWSVVNRRSIQKLRTLEDPAGPFWLVAWNPYGTMLASADTQRVVLWDAVSWTELRHVSVPMGTIQGIAWSPDGKELAINTSGSLMVWDVRQ